jgi:hypothetical protein
MNEPEVQVFNVDDYVVAPGDALAIVIAVYAAPRSEALVCLHDGSREIFALDKLARAPDRLVAQRQRLGFPA